MEECGEEGGRGESVDVAVADKMERFGGGGCCMLKTGA